MRTLLTALLVLLAVPASAQTFWSFDNDRARVESNLPHSASLPGTCSQGSVYVQTGIGFAFCDPANTWNVVGSGTITGSGASTRLTLWSGPTTLTSHIGLFWDSTTQRVIIGDSSTSSGMIGLRGKTSGEVQLRAADVAGSASFKLPIADGANGDCLVTDGAGQLTFSNTCAGGSGITSLGGLSAAVQTFSAGSTNINFSSAVSTHTFTWTGQLTLARGGTNADLTAGACVNCFVKTNGAGPTALTVMAPPIPATQGGTGFTSFAGGVGGVFYANSTTTMGLSSTLVNHGVVLGGGTGNPPKTITPGAVGLFLQSQGAGADPIWAPSAGGGCAGGGNVTIADLNTTATVTFAAPLADALYSVVLSIRPGTGNPALTVSAVSNVTANGFQVNLGGAPGSGKTFIASWVVTPSSCTF